MVLRITGDEMSATIVTDYHPCISLDNLRRLYLEGRGGFIEDDNGRVLTEHEVYQLCRDEQAKGYKYFCGCDNRDSDGRCLGHKKEIK